MDLNGCFCVKKRLFQQKYLRILNIWVADGVISTSKQRIQTLTNHIMKSFLLLLTLLSCTLSAQQISWDKPGQSTKTVVKQSPAYERAYRETEVGNATYYADYLAGRPTAYGETYRPDQLTASHSVLPIGTILEVRRLDSNTSTRVRINDNNGHSDGSIVVLSRAAAAELGMLEVGRTRVSVTRVGFNNWNPQPKQQNQQLTARSVVATPQQQPTAYGQVNVPTNQNQRTVVPRSSTITSRTVPASRVLTYRTPAPEQANVPDFSNVNQGTPYPNAQEDPAANRPAFYPTNTNLRVIYPDSDGYYNEQAAANSAESMAIAQREVNVPIQQNRSGYIVPGNNEAAPVTTYSQVYVPANAAPVGATMKGVSVSPTNTTQRGYGIQLAAYGNLANAQRQVLALENQGVENIYVATVNRADGMVLNRVMVGPFPDAASAQYTADQLVKEKQIKGIVTRLP